MNEAAAVTLKFTRKAPGRSVGGHCVARTRRNARRRRCSRTVTAGLPSLNGHAGKNKIFFDGVITKHRRLAAGVSYTLLMSATAHGQTGPARTLHFAIIR